MRKRAIDIHKEKNKAAIIGINYVELGYCNLNYRQKIRSIILLTK